MSDMELDGYDDKLSTQTRPMYEIPQNDSSETQIIRQLQSDNRKLNELQYVSQNEIQRLSGIIRRLQDDNQKLKNELHYPDDYLMFRHDDELTLRSENQNLEKQLCAIRNENGDLKYKLKEFNALRDKHRAELQLKDSKIQELEALKRKNEEIINNLTHKSRNKSELSRKDSEIQELKRKNEELTKYKSRKDSEIQELKRKNEELTKYKSRNENELSRKDSEIQELKRKNEELTKYRSHNENELSRKDSEIQELKRKSEELTKYKSRKDSEIQELKRKNDELTKYKSRNENELSRKDSEIQELKRKSEELTKYKSRNENELSSKDSEIQELERKNKEDIKKLSQQKDEEFKRLLEKQLSSELQEYSDLLQKKEKENQELIEKNAILKAEASHYQSELGNATNFRMNDDDRNHPVQIQNDILSLQDMLKNYITSLKGNCEVNLNAVKILMKQYKIDVKITSSKPNKPLIKAVLQHHILKKIIKDTEDFFEINKNSGSVLHVEAEITSKLRELIGRLEYFSTTRKGTDAISNAASIKIRQEVNNALSNRGFSDISSINDMQEHPFIVNRKNDLNKEMRRYRTIKDEMKRRSVEEMAPNLIREFIRIIWFRLNVQEPSAQIKWIPRSSRIDPSIMEGSWDENEIDNLVVEICSFPMIGRDLDNVKQRKIFAHAQVFTKKETNTMKAIGIAKSLFLSSSSDENDINELD